MGLNEGMSDAALAVVVLAAGQGTRMKSSVAKVLHNLAGVPLIGHVVATAQALEPAHLAVVVRHQRDDVAQAVTELAPEAHIVDQDDVPGTGRALEVALEALPKSFAGDVVVVSGQTQATKFLRNHPWCVRGIVRHDAPRLRLRHFGHRVDGVRHGRGSAVQDTVGIDDESVEGVNEGGGCGHGYTDPGDPGSSSGFALSAAEIGPMRGNPASDRARNVALT